MKTALLSFLIAALLETAVVASGRLFDLADFVAVAFTTGLVVWTVVQYSAEPRSLTLGRRIHLPIKNGIKSAAGEPLRRVA